MKKEDIKKIYDFLRDNNYIEPGTSIESDILSSLIGETDIDSMEYIGPLILLGKHIEQCTGLFCKLVDKGIHIFSEDDSAYISKKKAEKAERITKDTYRTLLKTNIDNISNQEKRMQHLHQVNIFCMLSKN